MSEATFDPTIYNTSHNTTFDSILDTRFSRRKLLSSGSGIAAMAAFSTVGLSACGGSSSSPNTSSTDLTVQPSVTELGFQSINGAKLDAVVVAPGYKAQVLAPWGTPLNDNANPWQDDGTNTAQDQLNAVGMHHDGMRYFAINGSSEDGLLVVNHEYIDQNALHANGKTVETINDIETRTLVDEIRKEIYAHGVTVARITKTNGTWNVVKNDPLNRRYNGATEMDVSGPLFMSPLLTTKYSPDGRVARGTLNNCGNGYTPWGTYLTCEENWPGYFVNTGERTADQDRIGVGSDATRYGWDQLAGDPTEQNDEFARFNITPSASTPSQDYRNEANGYGYIVEIDPFTQSRAIKRTALGRFRHEGCEPRPAVAGEPIVFYSGHDARFEYIYKYESDALWDPADANRIDRLAVGEKYMDAGTLYVARFGEEGQGEWLPLTLTSVTLSGDVLGDSFATQADIILNTAGAADLLGATKMDRPEWCAVDPITGTAYMTLTNNTRRTDDTNIANPRLNNKFGHIIRWDEKAGTAFEWDIFVFGAPADGDSETNLSGLTDLNQFASPDGLVFDSRGILWIQTDNGASEVKDGTNDQMLAVIPSQLTNNQNQQMPLRASNQAELKRFFVGPNRCEVTGLAFTDNNTAFFANIQHPGNWPFSNDATQITPEGVTLRPRAATVVIEKIDGGAIGE